MQSWHVYTIIIRIKEASTAGAIELKRQPAGLYNPHDALEHAQR